jgi:integrase
LRIYLVRNTITVLLSSKSYKNVLPALLEQGWEAEALLDGIERKPEGKRVARALDAQKVESALRKIENPRDRALFWLIYDGGLRCQEALAVDIEDISWPDRSIRLHGKGDRPREMFFSRAVGTLLDKYLATRGYPTSGPLFVTHRKARLPRRADLDADGYARLSYRLADTLWDRYTWDLHQLRYTAISVRAAHDYTEVDLKRFSGHSSLRSLETLHRRQPGGRQTQSTRVGASPGFTVTTPMKPSESKTASPHDRIRKRRISKGSPDAAQLAARADSC